MHINRLRLWTVASAAVALLGAGVIAGPAYAATASTPAPPAPAREEVKPGQITAAPLAAEDEALLARQDVLMPVAQDLVGQANSTTSDIGGVAIDVEAGVVNLYRTDPSRRVLLSTGASPDGVTVLVHPARFNRTSMVTTTKQITGEARALSDEGLVVQAVGPSVDGSGVIVSVAGDPADRAVHDRATETLRKHYGDMVGTVNLVARPITDTLTYFGGFRFNDFAPWFGGDRITDSNFNCTSGFPAELSGKPVMLTAGHCGDNGSIWFSGPGTNGSSKFMGSMVFDDDSTDIAAIAVSSASSSINVGPALTPSQAHVDTWASPVVGQLLCQSGSFTGEVCGLKVVATGQDQCKASFIWCVSWFEPLTDLINTKGSNAFAAGHGDSGGPVYRRHANSSVVTAVGLVHGQLSDDSADAFPAFVPDTLSCPAPEGTKKRCSAGFSIAQMPGH